MHGRHQSRNQLRRGAVGLTIGAPLYSIWNEFVRVRSRQPVYRKCAHLVGSSFAREVVKSTGTVVPIDHNYNLLFISEVCSRRCQVPRNHDFRSLERNFLLEIECPGLKYVFISDLIFFFFLTYDRPRSRNMYSDGHEVDGSWVLCVYVTNLQMERSLRVKGELHIGGVMLRLVEDLGESSKFIVLF